MGLVKGKGWTAIVLGPEPEERRGAWVRNGKTWALEGAGIRAEVTEEAKGARCRMTFDGRPIGSFVTRSLEGAMKHAAEWIEEFGAARVVRAKEA